ncbi:hypothetical protein DICPUDRAFT_147997 [Dictyostelium purpureum]|uniref:Uncharacterized protein n=1 Tax=Dictyostelium purpureum TaxID=5786 RepID=F0Z9Z3_DICPU|nr:uncharacterized protein DICPUDRAFT_147997 [Dictyostelium purpureum]EGC39201.1 hypothetical protein DICPUDRAFT_147997 [Dictyostelium purpureum]|eukprot:XP_003284228.1 hypothetical protein DICPUDRAFT_147997 [Dictyostelium purpureum]
METNNNNQGISKNTQEKDEHFSKMGNLQENKSTSKKEKNENVNNNHIKEKSEKTKNTRLLANRIVQIRIIKKRVFWQPEIYYSVGVRISGSLVLASNDHFINFQEKSTTIEIGVSNEWHKGTLIDTTDPLEPTDCALLSINDLDEQQSQCETLPVYKKKNCLNWEIIYFDFPNSRLPLNACVKDKNFKELKPLCPSVFSGRVSYFDENTLEVALNGTTINEFENKSRVIFSGNNGELYGILRKKPNNYYYNTNVLYCTKGSAIKAWVDTTLKKNEYPPLWDKPVNFN